jgi:two-component system, NtrC family, nitrogen regulation sensor histidine kinase NtrY
MVRIGKFEWKIILALLVTAAVPLLFTVFILDRLVKDSMAVGLNERVLTGLRSGVDLYKEAIESRIRIVRLQGQALVRDSAFVDAVSGGDMARVRNWLEDLVAGNASISAVRLLAGDSLVAQEKSALMFPEEDWKSKTEEWEMPDGHRLEITLVITRKFLAASDTLRDLVLTLEDVQQNFQPWKMAYYRLFLFIYTWILVAAVVFGLLLSRSVTRRVANLAQATRLAARGDLAVRVPVRKSDEIGELSASFNLMMDDIQRGRDRIVYLEKISAWQGIAQRLAHEIKNPLTPIQLAIQELHRSYRGDDPIFLGKLNDSLEIVEEEVGTLRRLVETFTEFSKMPEVQADSVELNAFVTDFLKHNPHIAGRVSFESGPEVHAQLDRTMMGRVLINLVNNGIEAGDPEDMIILEVGRGKGWGTIRVIDHGEGLSKEARDRIFQPYFTTKPEGTGLGLAIVKKIILQHGGEITVEDGETSGTVFEVRLRAEENHQKESV